MWNLVLSFTLVLALGTAGTGCPGAPSASLVPQGCEPAATRQSLLRADAVGTAQGQGIGDAHLGNRKTVRSSYEQQNAYRIHGPCVHIYGRLLRPRFDFPVTFLAPPGNKAGNLTGTGIVRQSRSCIRSANGWKWHAADFTG